MEMTPQHFHTIPTSWAIHVVNNAHHKTLYMHLAYIYIHDGTFKSATCNKRRCYLPYWWHIATRMDVHSRPLAIHFTVSMGWLLHIGVPIIKTSKFRCSHGMTIYFHSRMLVLTIKMDTQMLISLSYLYRYIYMQTGINFGGCLYSLDTRTIPPL